MRDRDKYADEYEYGHDEEEAPDPQLDEAVQEALDGEPHAEELRQMRAVLEERRARLCRELDAADDAAEREALRREVKKLDEQIAVLSEEAEINKFVEDAVRFSVEARRLS